MSENRLNHMVMILNENIEEGEEFLLYAYPNDRHELKDSIAEKLLRTRDVIATMRGVTVQLAGQQFRVANISDDGEAQIKVKISSVEVAEGLVLALIAPKETHDVLLCRMSSSIVNCLEMCYGPQRTLQDFLDLIGYEAAEEYNQNDVKISTSARTALDPFFKQYFGSFLSGSCETRILEALPNCIPCHVPPLQTKTLFELELMSLNDGVDVVLEGRGGGAGNPADQKDVHSSGRRSKEAAVLPQEEMSSVTGSSLWYKGHMVCRRMNALRAAEITRYLRLQQLLIRTGGSSLHVSTHYVYLEDAGKEVATLESLEEDGKDKAEEQEEEEEEEDHREGASSKRRSKRKLATLLVVGVNSFLCACTLRRRHIREEQILKSKAGQGFTLVSCAGSSSSAPQQDPAPLLLVAKIKAMIMRVQKAHLGEHLDALVRKDFGLLDPSKKMELDIHNSNLNWTTHAKTKKAYRDSITKIREPTLLGGPFNTLLFYINVFHLQGMLVSCHPYEFSDKPQSVVVRFLSTVIKIHSLFHLNDDGEDNKDKSVKHAHKRRESREHKRSSQISEMGLRLRVASQTSIQETFWVVGRRNVVSKREAYMCYRDTIPQDMVNMLFRTTFAM